MLKKILKHTLRTLLVILLVLLLVPALLYVPAVQDLARRRAVAYASRTLGMEVSVERIRLAFPLRLTVDNTLLADRTDTLLRCGRLSLDAALWPLIRKEVVIRSFALERVAAHYKDTLAGMDLRLAAGELSLEAVRADLSANTAGISRLVLADADIRLNLTEAAPAEKKESAAALQKAKDAAAAVLETVKSGILPEKAAKEYESIATYSHPESGTYSGDAATKWVFDDSRQAGDTELVENGTFIYLLIFHSRSRNDYNTVDVRHILFKVDTSSLDSKADDYQAKLEELKAGKKQEAENALQAWKDGDATEESFAALANKLSEDPGSNTNGGLYKQVYKGQMVSEFNDWCFDESRKAGDTGIVANDAAGGSYIGYHVMYFVGTDDPYWMVQVRNAMTNKDYSEWSANLVKDITATENSGMKYVG